MKRLIIEKRVGAEVLLTAREKRANGLCVDATVRVSESEYLALCKKYGIEPMGPHETRKIRKDS